jgi:pteridine reductase
VFARTPLESLTDADWERSLAVNLRAPYEIALGAVAHLRRAGVGKIVNIVDRVAAGGAYRDYLPYIAAKTGLVGLTRALAIELAPTVQVNAVAPGAVLLPDDFSPAQRAAVAAAIPGGRSGEPADVAAAVRFLIEGSDFITGQVLVVDGGRSVWAE